jgi:hypothetical protein
MPKNATNAKNGFVNIVLKNGSITAKPTSAHIAWISLLGKS